MAYNGKRRVYERTRFDYEPLMERLQEIAISMGRRSTEGKGLSDKIAAEMCEVSESVIRKARLEGMNPYMADYLCIKGLGMTPQEFYGDEAWLNEEALRAEEIYETKGKILEST